MRVLELRHLEAAAIFDLEDAYARDRGVLGPHPRIDGPVRLLLVGRMTPAGREEIAPAPELELRRNDRGYDLFFGIVRSPGAERTHLDEGTYVVRVDTDGRYQRAERADVRIPEPAVPYVFDLAPGHAYAFPSGSSVPRSLGPTLLRGALQGPDGAGLADATVEVVGVTERYLTDRSGQWVLVFPDGQASGDVTVRFGLPDGSTTDVASVPVAAGREATLAQTALRGQVVTNAGRPIAGAVVSVGGRPGSARSGPDGAWSYFFGVAQAAINVNVTATLPDGRSQTAPNVPVQPRATVVVPRFRFA